MKKKTKFFVLRMSIILAFVVLAGRLWYLQVVMAGYYKGQADTSKIRDEPVQALRGIIYDRFGRPLVLNGPSWNAEIVPHGVPKQRAKSVYRLLAQILANDPSSAKIDSMVKENRWKAYAPFILKSDIPADAAMLIKQLHGRLPGVRAEPSTARKYLLDPQGSLAHILGYAGKIGQAQFDDARRNYGVEHVTRNDQAGQSGLELAVDQYLHGVNGTQQVEVDSGERPVRVLRHGTSVSGDSVYLTIDARLQRHVANDLAAGLHQLGLRQGVAVVEDVRSGQILSAVSLPSFDNNWFSAGTGIKQRQYDALLNDPTHPLTDLTTSGLYPPGSTYKIITAAAALETHVADGSRYIVDTGSIKLCSVYNSNACQTFQGWQAGGLGAVNVVTALAKSSDIFFYTVAGGNPNVDTNMSRVGSNRLAFYARLFGLGDQTGIELPGEASGLVPSQTWFAKQRQGGPYRQVGASWHIGDTYNMAIGQGFNTTTPLQMVNVVATVANGGTLYRPRLVRRIQGRVLPRLGILSHEQSIQPFVPTIVRRNFVAPDNLALIQQGMHESVWLPGTEGTSYNVRDPRIDAAGKTGTAESGIGKPPHAWWVGYAPFQNPKIAVCVMIPYANSEGATSSAPIAHKIFEDYFHLKPQKANWLADVQQFLVGTGRAG